MELSEIRKQLDVTNEELLATFLKRMKLSGEVAAYKSENDVPVVDRERERQILERVREESGDMERYANALFLQLFSLSRIYQDRLVAPTSGIAATIERSLADHADAVFPATGTIACPGVEGGNSQVAADRLFPRGNLVYLKTFEAVFDAVESGLCDFGVLPIENSSNGSVREVYDLLRAKKAFIVRSARLHIDHELIAREPMELSDVKKVLSHPQAFGQCSDFLSKLPADVELVPCTNTAEAARIVSESSELGITALASHECVDLYELTTLATHVQNSENNYTRFIAIAREPIVYPGANRISLVLTCKHRPGALYSIMGAFTALGINLLKLESCPIPGEDFEFMFFFDLEADVHDEDVRGMLAELERECERFVFLGNYLEV